jgi:hypothetical protein
MLSGPEEPTPIPPGPAFTTISPSISSPVVVNDDNGYQVDARISGSHVSYTSNADGTNRIRHHDLATSADAVVPNAGEDDFLSDISGSKIVFTRVNLTSAIYLYDAAAGSAPFEIAPSATGHRRDPAIGGNTVAWMDNGFHPFTNQLEIVIHDLLAGITTRLTTDGLLNTTPSVSPDGNVVVWRKCQDPGSGTGCDIWKAVRAAGVWITSAITGSEGEERLPDVDGQIITYLSTRVGETDIYWQPVGGGIEQQLAVTGIQANPSISEGLITFDSRDATGNGDVWAYDIATGILFQLTNEGANETLNDVWVSPTGLVRVVYTSDATGDGEPNLLALSFQRPVPSALYDFTGFFQPVDNSPAVNKAKAGSAIPVKFSLGGDQGLDIFPTGYPLTKAGACDLTGSDVIEQTVTAGGSSLHYDPATDQYTYVWKTDRAWAGTCRQLVVGLNDGTTHTAWFNFVK